VSHAASEWMPWDGEEFWNSPHVAEMSNDEALLYQWALWQNWKGGSIPAQPETLRRMLPGRFAKCFDRAWKTVAKRFDIGLDGRLRNARVAKDLCAAADRVAKCAIAGRASAASRRSKLASVASEQPTPVEHPFNGRSTDVQHGADGMGSDGSLVPSEPGADKPPRSRGKRGPREPNAYETAWYDTMRAHYHTEPAKLAPHGSIALGRLGKTFGAPAIAAKLKSLLIDDRLRKFATPKYLEDNWNSIQGGLFAQKPSHGLTPEHVARLNRILAAGEPPKDDRNAYDRWRAAKQEVVDHRLTPEALNGSH